MNRKNKNHESAVQKVQSQVSNFFERGQRARIYHGGTNSTRPRSLDQSQLIDISGLNNILEINTKSLYAVVEPNVNLGQLVDATLEHGLVPPVISEFPAITVGGAIQGGAGQSSSFKYGCFHELCMEYELVLGDGSRINASTKKNAVLFYGIPCSFGTLGIITKVKLRLIPAMPYVSLRYYKVKSGKEAMKLINGFTSKGSSADFVDGVMFSKTSGVIMEGFYSAESKKLPKVTFHKIRDEWFYLHAEKVTRQKEVYEELVPIKDYLFRYDRGAFWAGRAGILVAGLPFNRLTRLVLAPMFKTKTMYKFLHGARLSQKFLVQDNLVPKRNVVSFMEYVDKNYGVYPLWLCPLRASYDFFLSPTTQDTDLTVDVGVWGALVKNYDMFVQQNRELEAELYRNGGRKVLYAHGYYTNEEFWQIYDKSKYDALRKKYHAEKVFPDKYEKIHVSERHEPNIVKGFLSLISRF